MLDIHYRRVGHQVVFQAAAAIFISEGEREKITKGERKQTEISLYKETADGRRVEKVR